MRLGLSFGPYSEPISCLTGTFSETGLSLQQLDMKRQSPKTSTITMSNAATTVKTSRLEVTDFFVLEECEFSGAAGLFGCTIENSSGGGAPAWDDKGGEAVDDVLSVVVNWFPACLCNKCKCYQIKHLKNTPFFENIRT